MPTNDPKNLPPADSPERRALGAVEASVPDRDGDLMGRSARGDTAAFGLLYDRYARAIMSFLHHALSDSATAEDLCQETFVRAWRAASRFRPDAPLAPWLFRIARNVLSTEYRRRRGALGLLRRLERGAGARAAGGAPSKSDPSENSESGGGGTGGGGSGGGGSGGVWESEDEATTLRRRLADAVAALSERTRAAFVLVRMQGLGYDAAAALLDVPVGTVKSRCAAAEAWLRRRLARDVSLRDGFR